MKRLIYLSLLLTLPVAAFTPILNRVEPPGGQRGTALDIQLRGERLNDINGALFYEPGISLSDFQTKDGKTATAKFTISADAAQGEHSFRLTGPDGITELRSFWVGDFPTVPEKEPNGRNDAAQRVKLNRTIQGTSGNEDDDCFVCALKKGQRLSVEVEAMRLGRAMFDAYVAILDPHGFELAACDDAMLLRTDAFVSILAPENGDYKIIVREAAYEGNDQCRYRLHIGTFPRPTSLFPPGGKPGETLEFTFTGDPSGPIKKTFTLPNEAQDHYPLFPNHDGLSAPSPHSITISPLPSTTGSGKNLNPKAATPTPPLPCALHGILDQPKTSNWYKFFAKKGRNLVIRTLARTHRSPLDSVLSIHQMNRKQIANNDDQGAPDSIINWTCPADGEYLIQIRDHLRRGGPEFIYRIEITDKAPSITATMPVVERNKSQKWKTFPIPRGNRYAAVINVTRKNLACDAIFESISLPPGVTMRAARIPRSVTSFPVVFEAAPDAPDGASLHEFRIRRDGGKPALTGHLTDTIHHVEINNEGSYHSVTSNRIATAITNEAPFKIDIAPPRAPIVKNGTLKLYIKAHRNPDFKGKIIVRFLWKPPGISSLTTVDIPPNKNSVSYELNASADAAPGDWEVCVLAEANTPNGPVLTSSTLTPLTIAEPYLTMTLDLAAAEAGKPAAMIGKIETLRPFKGSARAMLSGLPYGVTCTPQSFTTDQTEITFPLKIAADARTGKHSGLFCNVEVPEGPASVHHQTAMGGTLRIDPAAKNDPVAKNAPEKKAAPESKPAKPLSRLEQLRQRRK